MKRFFLFFLASVTLVGCSWDDPSTKLIEALKREALEKQEQSVQPGIEFYSEFDAAPVIPGESDKTPIYFNSNMGWKAEATSSWFSISPKEGEPGDGSVVIKAEANEEFDTRSGKITFTSGYRTFTITVVQSPKSAIILEKDSFEVGKDGGTITVVVKTTVGFETVVPREYSEWIGVEPYTKSLETRYVQLNIARNKGAGRTGYVDLVNKEKGLSARVTVTQEVRYSDLPYVEIEALYNGSTPSILRWYRQNLAITESGKKHWKGDNTSSAVKVPGRNEYVAVGDYFQWGAYAGYCGSGSGTDKGLLLYTAFTNKGCGDGSDGFTFKTDKTFYTTNAPYYSGSAYTKYNTTDQKKTLDASDDVASIILGGTWRMPASAEFQAMKDATYWAWDATDKGIYVFATDVSHTAGTVVGAIPDELNKFDALLFLPVVGDGSDSGLKYVGSGSYWSSTFTLNSYQNTKANYLNFEVTSVNPQISSVRYYGFSVRPVQDPDAIYLPVTNVSLDESEAEIEDGCTVQLSATVSPDNATNKGVYWTSSNESVATVDATGKVTAKAAGTATITVTTVDGGKTATCAVTVKAAIPAGALPEE